MKTMIWLGPLLAVALLVLPAGVAAQTPMASLSVGSGSGLPGATGVSVPVSLSSQGGAQVAGLNLDLTFDSSRLAVGSVTIGSAASSAGKSLSWTQPAANRIRVIIVGFNQDAIPDGTVAVVNFNVLGGAAPGTSSLTLSSTAASDPTGNPVPVNASNGSFEVLAPPATNTPTATATSTITPTDTATATLGGPTNTNTPTRTGTPTPTRTLTPTPGGPTSTAGPTKTRTPAPTQTPVGTSPTQAGVPTILPTGTPGSALTITPGSDGDPGAILTAEAATAAAEFELAVAGTATALAEFDAAVKATATALAGGNKTPTPENGRITPRPTSTGLLLVGAGALALIAIAAAFAFILIRRRQ